MMWSGGSHEVQSRPVPIRRGNRRLRAELTGLLVAGSDQEEALENIAIAIQECLVSEIEPTEGEEVREIKVMFRAAIDPRKARGEPRLLCPFSGVRNDRFGGCLWQEREG